MKYCTLYRVGYWASFDAECDSEPADENGMIRHNVTFKLINQFGDSNYMGHGIFTGNLRGEEVYGRGRQ